MDYLNFNYKNIFLKEGCNTFELFFVQSLQPLLLIHFYLLFQMVDSLVLHHPYHQLSFYFSSGLVQCFFSFLSVFSYHILLQNHQKKQWKEKGNYFNSNEFKLSVKHNMSNQSIDNIKGITHYGKKSINIRKRVSQVKKNYVSPYSKKNIMNNIQI